MPKKNVLNSNLQPFSVDLETANIEVMLVNREKHSDTLLSTR